MKNNLLSIVLTSYLFVFTLVVMYIYGIKITPNGDNIEHLNASWLIWQGYMPYKDFFQHHNPLLWYIFAPLIGKITNQNVADAIKYQLHYVIDKRKVVLPDGIKTIGTTDVELKIYYGKKLVDTIYTNDLGVATASLVDENYTIKISSLPDGYYTNKNYKIFVK